MVVKAGNIYQIDFSGTPHHGHCFMVTKGNSSRRRGIYYDGICSCGEYDWWCSKNLKPIPQTEELKQLFANLILKQ